MAALDRSVVYFSLIYTHHSPFWLHCQALCQVLLHPKQVGIQLSCLRFRDLQTWAMLPPSWLSVWERRPPWMLPPASACSR